jgi:hypothetical protein
MPQSGLLVGIFSERGSTPLSQLRGYLHHSHRGKHQPRCRATVCSRGPPRTGQLSDQSRLWSGPRVLLVILSKAPTKLFGKHPLLMSLVVLLKVLALAIKRNRHKFFISKEKVPPGRKVTYGRIVSSIRHQKLIAPNSQLAATVLTIPVTHMNYTRLYCDVRFPLN